MGTSVTKQVRFALVACGFAAGMVASSGDVTAASHPTSDGPETVLISQSTSGTPGDRFVRTQVVSQTRQFVAFETDAALVSNDNNTDPDIYLRDLGTGVTTLVSLATNGQSGNHMQRRAGHDAGRSLRRLRLDRVQSRCRRHQRRDGRLPVGPAHGHDHPGLAERQRPAGKRRQRRTGPQRGRAVPGLRFQGRQPGAGRQQQRSGPLRARPELRHHDPGLGQLVRRAGQRRHRSGLLHVGGRTIRLVRLDLEQLRSRRHQRCLRRVRPRL